MGVLVILALLLCAAAFGALVERRHAILRTRQEMGAAVDATNSRWRSLIMNAADLVVVIDEGGIVQYATPACERLMGYPVESTIGLQVLDLIHADDVAFVVERLATFLDQPGTPGELIEFRVRRSDGEYTWVESIGTNLLHEPAVRGIVCNVRDISERKAAEEQLRRQARSDLLTGLPNRAELARVIDYRPGGATDRDFALLLMDLDRFKEINDGLGHHIGDQVLVEVSNRLLAAVRDGDTVVRLGGDEFAIVAEGLNTPAAAVAAARRLGAQLDRPIELDGVVLYLHGSIGIAIANAETSSSTSLLQRADVAMYRAKEQGLGCAVFGEEDLENRPARLALLSDLRRALDEGGLQVHYQPQLDLQTGQVVQVEALARWTRRDGVSIPPSEFIPLAEQTGLIRPLTTFVLGKALEQIRLWSAIGLDLSVAVNISPSSLRDPSLVTTVAEAIATSGVDPSRLTLEITESALAEHTDTAFAVLQRLRQLGTRLAIDDFGSGYSSMAYLKRLPIDELKIDRAFIVDLDRDPRDAPIVEAITTLGHSLGLLVVGEGVESESTEETLRSFACDRAQGYAIARPAPGHELTEWLEERAGVNRRFALSGR